MLKGKMKLETLGVCEDFCKDTRFLQYHESTYCGCFLECDFKRPANEYNSKADVYEQQNFGMISSRNIYNWINLMQFRLCGVHRIKYF